jgi:hypothetical protein
VYDKDNKPLDAAAAAAAAGIRQLAVQFAIAAPQLLPGIYGPRWNLAFNLPCRDVGTSEHHFSVCNGRYVSILHVHADSSIMHYLDYAQEVRQKNRKTKETRN